MTTPLSSLPLIGPAARLHTMVFAAAERIVSHDAIAFFFRLTIAGVFWRSLLTKVQTFGLLGYTELINDFPVQRYHVKLPVLPLDLRPAVIGQFENDFALPLIPGEVAAWLATLAEFTLPILIVLGVFTRLSALGLLAMTLVIQIFVFPGAWWSAHALWAALLIYLIMRGGGAWSLDGLAGRFAPRRLTDQRS
ncbi:MULTISPECIES: DoxX family protein [Hyphobacterium]|uniref:DoxX family protein n=1 Tax=Hyphobacterium vulgare TaxID=1736751 RepID=A0ABV6ZVX0_9PROT